jgi:hypothetical protein
LKSPPNVSFFKGLPERSRNSGPASTQVALGHLQTSAPGRCSPTGAMALWRGGRPRSAPQQGEAALIRSPWPRRDETRSASGERGP